MKNPLIMNLPELESDTDEHLQEKWGGIDLPLKLQVESQQNLSTFLEPTCPQNANTTGTAFLRNKENKRNWASLPPQVDHLERKTKQETVSSS